MISLSRCMRIAGILLCHIAAFSQSDNPYHLNGNAYQENCNCYTLTPDQFNQSGSVWNINKISLNEPFDYKFSLYLGCNNGDGADGIAFVLQPISTSIGAVGGGMGYDGVSPSIGILVDTWQNYEDSDPTEDHIAIHKNGIIDQSPLTDLAEPVTALASGGNIEDCQWHTLRVIWDPATRLLKAQMDGVDRVQATVDLVNDIFNGDDLVFWGFTAATGGAKNHQRVCTSLDAKFIFPEGQTTCFPQTLQFIDSSTSFGTIEKWYWDFGDGTTSELPVPPPHNYAAPGVYETSLKILGNNGCLSEPFVKKIVMGTTPIPRFSYSPQPVCEGTSITLIDSSYVEFGTINQWAWKIGNQSFSGRQPPSQIMTGTNEVRLSVSTMEGCISADTSITLTTFPVPSVDFSVGDICLTEPLQLKGVNLDPSVGIRQWYWNLGDGMSKMNGNAGMTYQYRDGGEYAVQLTAFSENGCPSQTVVKSLNVYQTNAFAGNDTIVAVNQPIQLGASGGDFYRWSPSIGLNSADIPNPIATLDRSMSYVLMAYTESGCETSDTLNIKVYKGPAFYVPSAFTPDNDGNNDDFRFVAVGMSSIELFRVYNRYGQVVYSSTSVMSGWDGRLAGKEQPQGTYIWMIKGVDFNGTPHFKKGTVTLIR